MQSNFRKLFPRPHTAHAPLVVEICLNLKCLSIKRFYA